MAFTVVDNVTELADYQNGISTRFIQYEVDFTLPDIAATTGTDIVTLPAVGLTFDEDAYAIELETIIAEEKDDAILGEALNLADNGEDVLPFLLLYPQAEARRPLCRQLIRHKAGNDDNPYAWVAVVMALQNFVFHIRELVPGTFTNQQLANYLNLSVPQLADLDDFFGAFFDDSAGPNNARNMVQIAATFRQEFTN